MASIRSPARSGAAARARQRRRARRRSQSPPRWRPPLRPHPAPSPAQRPPIQPASTSPVPALASDAFAGGSDPGCCARGGDHRARAFEDDDRGVSAGRSLRGCRAIGLDCGGRPAEQTGRLERMRREDRRQPARRPCGSECLQRGVAADRVEGIRIKDESRHGGEQAGQGGAHGVARRRSRRPRWCRPVARAGPATSRAGHMSSGRRASSAIVAPSTSSGSTNTRPAPAACAAAPPARRLPPCRCCRRPRPRRRSCPCARRGAGRLVRSAGSSLPQSQASAGSAWSPTPRSANHTRPA
jgi:hypothetical protein